MDALTRVRFEADHLAVLEFLRAQGYPCPWTIETLRQCVCLRVERDGHTAAYVWAHYVDNTMVLQFHACANRHYPGRWLTQRVLDRLLATAELMSATKLTTITEGPLRPLIHRLLERLGFRPDGDAMSLYLEPEHDGTVLQAEDPRPGATASAERAARSE